MCVIESLLTGVHVCIPFQNNATPLYIASQKGHHEVVQSLLGAGADVNTARSVSNETSIVLAIHIKYSGIGLVF